MWKHFISDYLNFTKKERTGTWVILSLVCLVILLPYIYPFFIKRKTYDHKVFERAIASLKLKQADNSSPFDKSDMDNPSVQNYDKEPGKLYETIQTKSELFYFDPNIATTSDWKRLGIRDKTIATIRNYLSKGGKFYKKEDIGKIWGLHENEVKRLIPYIQIGNQSQATYYPDKQYEKKIFKKEMTKASVDVNIADSAALIALPGIGSKLARRIINFRDKLGGFYKIEQIGETFGLPDSTFQKIKEYLQLNNREIRRININTATIDEMKSHPYLRFELANAIVQFRNQHGSFSKVDDIKKIMIISEEVFDKVSPYLTVN